MPSSKKMTASQRKMLDRRTKTAQLMMKGMDREEISRHTGVTVKTVTTDVKWVLNNRDDHDFTFPDELIDFYTTTAYYHEPHEPFTPTDSNPDQGDANNSESMDQGIPDKDKTTHEETESSSQHDGLNEDEPVMDSANETPTEDSHAPMTTGVNNHEEAPRPVSSNSVKTEEIPEIINDVESIPPALDEDSCETVVMSVIPGPMGSDGTVHDRDEIDGLIEGDANEAMSVSRPNGEDELTGSSIIMGTGMDNGLLSLDTEAIRVTKEVEVEVGPEPVEPPHLSREYVVDEESITWEPLEDDGDGDEFVSRVRAATNLITSGAVNPEDEVHRESLWEAYKDVWRRVLMNKDDLDGDDVQAWFYGIEDGQPLTEATREFCRTSNWGKWQYANDKVRDDRVIITFVGFILVLAVCLGLIGLLFL